MSDPTTMTVKEYWAFVSGLWSCNQRLTCTNYCDTVGRPVWIVFNKVGKFSVLVAKAGTEGGSDLIGHFASPEACLLSLGRYLSKLPRAKGVEYSLNRYAERTYPSDNHAYHFVRDGDRFAFVLASFGRSSNPRLPLDFQPAHLPIFAAVLDSVAVEPVAVEPVAVEPVAVEPVAVEPVAVEPVAVEPVELTQADRRKQMLVARLTNGQTIFDEFLRGWEESNLHPTTKIDIGNTIKQSMFVFCVDQVQDWLMSQGIYGHEDFDLLPRSNIPLPQLPTPGFYIMNDDDCIDMIVVTQQLPDGCVFNNFVWGREGLRSEAKGQLMYQDGVWMHYDKYDNTRADWDTCREVLPVLWLEFFRGSRNVKIVENTPSRPDHLPERTNGPREYYKAGYIDMGLPAIRLENPREYLKRDTLRGTRLHFNRGGPRRATIREFRPGQFTPVSACQVSPHMKGSGAFGVSDTVYLEDQPKVEETE